MVPTGATGSPRSFGHSRQFKLRSGGGIGIFMSGLLPGERGVLTAIIVGICFEVSLLQDERGKKGAAPVRSALLGWRTDDLLRFPPLKIE